MSSKWVFDLWDHPSLEYLSLPLRKKLIKLFLFRVVLWHLLPKSDVWVIAMQEGILNYMPTPGLSTRLVYTAKGIEMDEKVTPDQTISDSESSELTLVYAGRKVTPFRVGSDLLSAVTLLRRSGYNVRLEIIGEVIRPRDFLGFDGIDLVGALSHQDTLKRLSEADVGVCLLDTSVLNYRYAYPIKIYEYIYYGKMILASDTEGIRAIIGNKDVGCLIRNNSEKEIKESILRLYELKQNAGSISEMLKDYSLAFDSQVVAKQLGDTLVDALELDQ